MSIVLIGLTKPLKRSLQNFDQKFDLYKYYLTHKGLKKHIFYIEGKVSMSKINLV